MTRKDYEAFAKMFAGELAITRQDISAYVAVTGIIFSTADIFARSNPSFDRARFYREAGLRP